MKIRSSLVVMLPIIMLGCKSNEISESPKGEWVWTNHELYDEVHNGLKSSKELDHQFVVSTNTCKIEALKIPIPSPSCTQPQREDCTGKTGFALGFCQGYKPQPRCNYSSVNMAQNAQVEVFESCMTLYGWEKIWQPYEDDNQNISSQ